MCIWAHTDRLRASQNSPKATTGIQGLRTGHEEEYFSEEHRMQTGKATAGHYTSDPPGRTLCSSWVELLGQEGRQPEVRVWQTCRQVALQGVQWVFPYLQGVHTTPAGLPSH